MPAKPKADPFAAKLAAMAAIDAGGLAAAGAGAAAAGAAGGAGESDAASGRPVLYELQYLPFRGRAEPIRLLFAFGDIPYEGVDVQPSQWPALRKTQQLPMLPVLYNNATMTELEQSYAIMRHLARVIGCYGDNEAERSRIDMIVDTVAQWQGEMVPVVYGPHPFKNTEAVARYFADAVPKYAEWTSRFVDMPSGLSVCPKITLADIVLFELVDRHLQIRPDCLREFPQLQALVRTVSNEPKIAKYLASRRPSELLKDPTRVPVCVTGATGFVASHLVAQLLDRGYIVRATVRDPTNRDKNGHLLSLAGAAERLHLVKADLLEEGSFDAAVAGCAVVFHTASPFQYGVTDPQRDLIDPAVKGTKNVLNACARAGTVKTLILTSSTAAIYGNYNPRWHIITEDDWSDSKWMEDTQNHYFMSKTLAERVAWDFVNAMPAETKIRLVSMNPTMVIGPCLQPGMNASTTVILDVAAKNTNNCRMWVDVRDVARAHILAAETPTAHGRYMLVGFSMADRSIHSVFWNALKGSEDAKSARPYDHETVPHFPYAYSCARAEEQLGLKFTHYTRTIADTARNLAATGRLRAALDAAAAATATPAPAAGTEETAAVEE